MNGVKLRIPLRVMLFGIAVVLQGAVPMMAAPAGTISHFNGKDLAGWGRGCFGPPGRPQARG